MMIAVAISSVGLSWAAEKARRRGVYCRERANFLSEAEQTWLRRASDIVTYGRERDAVGLSGCEWVDSPGNRAWMAARYRKTASVPGRLKLAYERAALRPWDPLPDDPARGK